MPIYLPVPLAKAQGQSIVHPQSAVRVTFLESCATQSPCRKNNALVLATGKTQCKALPCFLRAGHTWADSISIFQIVILTHIQLTYNSYTHTAARASFHTRTRCEKQALGNLLSRCHSGAIQGALSCSDMKSTGTYQDNIIWRTHAWCSTGAS